jgi:hypothetical protein
VDDERAACALGGLRLLPGSCRREKDAALNAALDPTQRRLVVALVVTVACLPLLVLDLLGGHDAGGTSEAAVVTTGVPEPSLVAAVTPSEPATTSTEVEATTSTTVPPSSPATTGATTSTTVPKATSRATTVTAAPRATTTTTTAPPAPVTYVAPAPAPGLTPTGSESSFLSCVRHRESRGVYTAVDPSGQFMGAYQIYQGGWDAVARSIGRADLVGVRPNTASPADQDTIALAMLRQYGTSPWGGSCG